MTSGPPGIVLAAGLGTRMRSQTPKVLHHVAGKPLLSHVLDAVRGAGARPVVVLSKESEPARAVVGDDAIVAIQEPPRGTGDAVRVALTKIPGSSGEAFIVYGDTPLLRAETLRALSELRAKRAAPLALLSGMVGTANAYGRIIRDTDGDVARIVEARLATADERRLPESNLGAYAVDIAWLRTAVARLRANETGEVFLTDLVALATADGTRVAAHCTDDPDEGMGVNTRVELAAAEDVVRRRIRERHMLAGVTFHDPSSSLVDADVTIAPDAIIRDTTIGERCRVEASVLEGATLEDDVRIGPYSHLRPGAYLEQGVEMGNFGEVKNARLGKGTKMHHFSYIGDAVVGQRVNIGAGTITLNYDGVRKHRTETGDDAFIGSDSLLRAPIKVGARSVTGAGSVVTKDVPDDMLAVGVPARIRKKTEKKDKT